MKPLVFVTILIFSIAMVSYGKPDDKRTSLVKNLTTAMHSSQIKSTANYGTFKKIVFSFNGKWVSAYFDTEDNSLIGFSIPVLVTDLPAGSIEAIQKSYSQYGYDEAIMFINESGVVKWFVSINSAIKPAIILEVTSKGKINFYTKR